MLNLGLWALGFYSGIHFIVGVGVLDGAYGTSDDDTCVDPLVMVLHIVDSHGSCHDCYDF